MRNLFLSELDSLAEKSDLISREGEHYSLTAFRDNVIETMARLYNILTGIEKKQYFVKL
jgi:predicted transcriptional regulator